MEYNSFTPEEIVFLYLRHKKYITVHNQVAESIRELNKEGVETKPSIEDLKDNSHVLLLEQLNEKLEPIFEIITDTDPDLLERIEKVVDNPMNLMDGEDFDFDADDDEDDSNLF